MRDLVDSLPEEFRTPSLRSLPRDLKALVVAQIQKTFKLLPKSASSEALKRDNGFYPVIERVSKYDLTAINEVVNGRQFKVGDRVITHRHPNNTSGFLKDGIGYISHGGPGEKAQDHQYAGRFGVWSRLHGSGTYIGMFNTNELEHVDG
jgi:hypothetical protein